MQAVIGSKNQGADFLSNLTRLIQGGVPSSRFSTRYHGMHTESNASAEHLPPELNCSLWFTNLPPDVTVHELLTPIRNIGRVWCSFINLPDYEKHFTAAAKVVFFRADSAHKLLRHSWTEGINIRGFRVKCTLNRIKAAQQADTESCCRVIIITGHVSFVNEASLTQFFVERFIFQIDEVTELIRAGDRAVVEYRFGSFRCQAQMGLLALELDRPLGFEKVEYGEDPCETGNTMKSYGIAGERIQGIGL